MYSRKNYKSIYLEYDQSSCMKNGIWLNVKKVFKSILSAWLNRLMSRVITNKIVIIYLITTRKSWNKINFRNKK